MIYLVEDDENVRELVCYALRSSGYEVEGFESSTTFWAQMEYVKLCAMSNAEPNMIPNTEPSSVLSAMPNMMPKLIILDIMLPDEDGYSILSKLKKARDTADLPVIMLTARSGEYDRIKGLDAGADDYVAKPFSVLELLARVRALLRRTGNKGIDLSLEISTDGPSQPDIAKAVNSSQLGHDAVTRQPDETITAGGLSLNYIRRMVKIHGKPVQLTFKEFELLHHLLKHKDMVLTRDQLLTHIWGYEYDGTSNRTVDMHIKTLRQKLENCGDMVKTIRGVGYKITWEDEIS